MQRIGELLQRLCFCGHTHVPGLFIERKDQSWSYVSPKECGHEYRVRDERNVGSVGQPRDGDWRASYVLFEGELIRFRRVDYDIDGTIQKMDDNPSCDPFLSERLRDGR